MNRLFDLVAVAAVAFVVLLPKASVQARPALDVDVAESSRVALLEDAVTRDPTNDEAACNLAEAYLGLDHPDWALVTLSRFPGATSSARVSLLRGTAYADRLEPALAVEATTAGRAVCEAKGCPTVVAARLSVIEAPMKALADQHIDPRKEQQRAREIVGKTIHSTHAPAPTSAPTE